MDIFLLRHFESIKNTHPTFSSIDDKEELTENGRIQGKLISEDLREIIKLNNWVIKKIYCAESIRAQQSAEIFAQVLSYPVEIQSYRELLSTKSKDIVGKTKEQVRKINPQFIKELSLYDAGLFSSYNFHREYGEKLKKEYEKTVFNCIKKIISNNVEENIKIIFLHNSSITAAVINYARELCEYPKNYYGKVNADNGKIFWIHKENNIQQFVAANCDSKSILRLIREGKNVNKANY